MIDGDTYASVEEQLTEAREDMRKILAGERDPVEITYAGNGHMNGGGVPPEAEEERGTFALVVNGHSLVRFLLLHKKPQC